jgi:hypothetical protein
MAGLSLIERLLAQRESWVELEPAGGGLSARRVRVRRPPETEFHMLAQGVEVEHLKAYVVGWDGITEADVLGAAVGASDPVPFDAALWGELAKDRPDWYRKAAHGLIEAITTHLAAKAADAKN